MKKYLIYKDLSLLFVSLCISQCFDLLFKYCWTCSFSSEDIYRLIISLILLILGGCFYRLFYLKLISYEKNK